MATHGVPTSALPNIAAQPSTPPDANAARHQSGEWPSIVGKELELEPGYPPCSPKFLYIDQKGNEFTPYPYGNGSLDLKTPIYDSARKNVLYTCTRFKKDNGNCVLTSSGVETETVLPEVHINFVGVQERPVITFRRPEGNGAEGGNSTAEISFKRKNLLTRSRVLDLQEFNIGGHCEWSYVSCKDLRTWEVPDNETPVAEEGNGAAVPATTTEVKKSETKEKSKSSKRPGPAARKMAMHYFPPSQDDRMQSSVDKLKSYLSASSQPTLVAEFVRTDDDAKVVVTGYTGFSGQGGWLKIYDEDIIPEWLIIATCLVMLKKERDRRSQAAAGALYS